MKPMNQNQLAKRIAASEGGKVNLSIAQIKEVLRIALDEMVEHEDAVECRAALIVPIAKGNVEIYQL